MYGCLWAPSFYHRTKRGVTFEILDSGKSTSWRRKAECIQWRTESKSNYFFFHVSIIYVKLIYDQHHFGEIETLVQDGLSQQVAQVRITISSKYGATQKSIICWKRPILVLWVQSKPYKKPRKRYNHVNRFYRLFAFTFYDLPTCCYFI